MVRQEIQQIEDIITKLREQRVTEDEAKVLFYQARSLERIAQRSYIAAPEVRSNETPSSPLSST